MDVDQAEDHEEEGGEVIRGGVSLALQQSMGSEEGISMAGKAGGKGKPFCNGKSGAKGSGRNNISSAVASALRSLKQTSCYSNQLRGKGSGAKEGGKASAGKGLCLVINKDCAI